MAISSRVFKIDIDLTNIQRAASGLESIDDILNDVKRKSEDAFGSLVEYNDRLASTSEHANKNLDKTRKKLLYIKATLTSMLNPLKLVAAGVLGIASAILLSVNGVNKLRGEGAGANLSMAQTDARNVAEEFTGQRLNVEEARSGLANYLETGAGPLALLGVDRAKATDLLNKDGMSSYFELEKLLDAKVNETIAKHNGNRAAAMQELSIGAFNEMFGLIGHTAQSFMDSKNARAKTNQVYYDELNLRKNRDYEGAAKTEDAKRRVASTLSSSFQNLVSNGFQGLTNILTRIADGIDSLNNYVKSILDWVSNKLTGLFQGFSDFFKNFGFNHDTAKKISSTVVGSAKVIGDGASAIYNKAKDKLGSWFNNDKEKQANIKNNAKIDLNMHGAVELKQNGKKVGQIGASNFDPRVSGLTAVGNNY